MTEQMYWETVKEIREAEDRCQQEKDAARAASQARIADAEKAGKALLEQTRALLRQQSDERRKTSSQASQQELAASLTAAEEACEALRRQAAERMEQASDAIVRKVVER